MATNVSLPQWGMNMEEGTLVKWLVQEGDSIEKGQPLVEIETSKINSELEAPVNGIIYHLMSPEGTIVKVGDLVAVIGDPNENPPKPEIASTKTNRSTNRVRNDIPNSRGKRKGPQITPVARRLARENNIRLDNIVGTGTNGRVTEKDVRSLMDQPKRNGETKHHQIVPRARRMASEHNLDLSVISGTGPNGRITVADVENILNQRNEEGSQNDIVVGSEKLSGLRKVISDRMSLSTKTMAQVTLTSEIDVSELVQIRKKLLKPWRSDGIRPMDQDLIVAAVGDTLLAHPKLNCFMKDETVLFLKSVNLGVAVAVEGGLVVPVIHSIDELSLLEIGKHLRDLANKARANSLSMADITGAGFTITSLMNYDIDVFTPIIDPPQVAIAGMGRITPKPVVMDGEIVVREMMHVSVTFDHRVLDGVPVAEFIGSLKNNIESRDWLIKRSGLV